MKKFILAVSILAIAEIIVLLILHIFYVYQYTFSDYIKELYKKFGLDMDYDSDHGNIITDKFEALFNEYRDSLSGLLRSHRIYPRDICLCIPSLLYLHR